MLPRKQAGVDESRPETLGSRCDLVFTGSEVSPGSEMEFECEEENHADDSNLRNIHGEMNTNTGEWQTINQGSKKIK